MLRRLFTVTLHLVPILLLLWLGWGWNDGREFFSNPARAGLVVVAMLGAGLAVLLGVDLHPLRRGTLPPGGQTLVLAMLAGASLFLIWFLPFADRRQILTFTHEGWLRYVGSGLCSTGVLVRLLALRKLGHQFSAYVTLQNQHQLVQSGIYGTIRHPLYLSLLLAAPGFALVFASVLAWPILGVTLIFVMRRVRQEDRLLASRFGDEFSQYQKRVDALLPRIG